MQDIDTPTPLEGFLRRTLRPAEGFLAEMEESARVRRIPVCQPETAAFLRFLVTSGQPDRILEIGTAIGFSTGVMALFKSKDGIIDTVEIDEDRADEAERNFHMLGIAPRVRVIRGDAREVLACLSGEYALVFLDAAKGQYPDYLDSALGLVRPGGVLVADNVLYKGLTAQAGPVPHKHRTIAARLRQSLSALCQNPSFETAILPVGDGVAVACRKRSIHE